MKRFFLFLVPAILTVVSSCNDAPKATVRCNTMINDYLFGVEYDDYDFDACKEFFDSLYIPSGACSEVRRGRFVGRNLDWYINRNASAVIKVNHTEDHFASIGVVGCFPQFDVELARSGEYDRVYEYLPFKTEDGVNERGVYVGVNVVPTGETSFDESTWRPHEYGLGAAHTNPSASLTCTVNYLPRIILDKAGSVEEAIKLIESIDWTEPVNYPHDGETQSFHWLICDSDRSVVLEFMDNKPHFTEAVSVSEPGFGTIMTNFTNCLREKGIMQINGIGYERYDILYDHYGTYPESFEGMQKLMEMVWFSKYYTIPVDSPDFWLSECADDDLPAYDIYKNYEILKDPYIHSMIEDSVDIFKDKSLWYTDDTPLWFSTHTSVYDIKSRNLHLLVHEGLDGMDEFYEASLKKSHFAKPLKKHSRR